MLEKNQSYYCSLCQNNVPKGSFCPGCGIHNKGEKSTLNTIFKNSISQVFSVEKGLIHNFRATFLKPNDVVWSYYYGIRNKYASPGKFLLYTLFILGTIFLIDPEFGAVNVIVDGESTNSLTGTKLFIVFIIPFLSLTSKIVFWRNNGFAIHVISVVYIFLPRFVIVAILITILNFWLGQHWSQALFVLIMLAVTFWTNAVVQKKSLSVLQKLGLTVIQFITFLGIIVLVIGVGVLLGYFDLTLTQ